MTQLVIRMDPHMTSTLQGALAALGFTSRGWLRRVLEVLAVTLMAALTIWTTAEAAWDFPSRWGGYLVLFCWLASAWSGLSLLRGKSDWAILLLILFAVFAIAGLPILAIAFSSD